MRVTVVASREKSSQKICDVYVRDRKCNHLWATSHLFAQETLEEEKEEFMFSTAADRRGVQLRRDKRAELESVLASSDTVGVRGEGKGS